MPSDRTRTSDDLRERYKAVVMQQGRVTLDRDWNALQDIVEGQIAANALDEIGAFGTPDGGFAISVPDPSYSAQAFSSHSAHQLWDFLIAPGTMYVGGQRVVLPVSHGNPWSYFNQPDWIGPAAPTTFSAASRSGSTNEYIYLHAYEQEVGAVEDADLLDVALGGPDTTARVRLMWRVHRATVDATDCATALAEMEAIWAADGLELHAPSMRLWPQAQLQVSFATAPAASSACDPTTQGGYLGALNQLIRLQISDPGGGGGAPQLLWGYDDASFLYRVTAQSGGLTLDLSQPPVDAYHAPATNQVVEVLRTAVVLGTAPDATDPTGTQSIVRCVANATGFVTTVASFSTSDNTVTLSSALPALYMNDKNPLFLRVWQGQQSIDLSSQPITLNDPTTSTSPGIEVTITVPAGGAKGAALPDGAYWMIAVRPSTPQAVYPERFLTAPQWPDGPRQWVCPLALIEWGRRNDGSIASSSGPWDNVIDCRQTFCNLVALSKRLGGCCSVSVSPTDAPNLQAIIDKATSAATGVTVCFKAGTYSLEEPLRLSAQHTGLTLEGCNGGVTLEASADADMTTFLDGLIVLMLANDVSLKNLSILAPSVPLQQALEGLKLFENYSSITSAPASLQSVVGIRLVQCLRVTIEGCSMEFAPQANFLTVGFGVYVTGNCSGLAIRECRFASNTSPTITNTTNRDVKDTDLAFFGSVPVNVIAGSVTAPASTQAVLPSASVPVSTTGPVADSQSAAQASPPGLVALFGVFAGEFQTRIALGGAAIRLVNFLAMLDQTDLSDNKFYNLTLAIWVTAEIGTLAVKDNHVTSCFGGFWLEAADFAVPAESNDPQNTYSSLWSEYDGYATGFQEISTGTAVAGFLPLAAGVSATQVETLQGQQPAAGPLAVTLSGNHVDAWLPSALDGGGAAIRLLLNRTAISGQDTTASLVMDANSVRGDPPVYLPLVLMATGAPTVVTGNLMFYFKNDRIRTLMIFPAAGFALASYLTVIGNVFTGSTNLGQITRADVTTSPLAPAFSTWVPFNSTG
jgi:Family of unknown function (DUF6519)